MLLLKMNGLSNSLGRFFYDVMPPFDSTLALIE